MSVGKKHMTLGTWS